MHSLHEHVSQTLADKLAKRQVVVWYDARGEFRDFVAELLPDGLPATCQVDPVTIGGNAASLCVLHDSFFEAKFAVEAIVSKVHPDPLLVYIPEKKRDDDTAVLMELEAGGDRWEPQLKREARRVLKRQLGDGQIDQLLSSPNISYADIVGVLAGGQGQSISGSLLEGIYGEKDNAGLIAGWLATSDRDDIVAEKGAHPEMFQLLDSRLGLSLAADTDLKDARRKACRYVLLAEFRNDLKCAAPSSLNLVEQPSTKQLGLVLQVAEALRRKHSEAYVQLADGIEQELHLGTQGIAPETLGKIDTFRFEEECLLDFVGQQIVDGNFQTAQEIVEHRRLSFWALHQLQRQEQWQAYGLAAKLGLAVKEVTKQLPDSKKTAIHWIEGYVAEKGWYRVDLLHRRLESTLSAMTDTIASEMVIHRVRQDYEQLVGRMTTGFIAAFKDAGWNIPGVLHQTEVYSKQVLISAVCGFTLIGMRIERTGISSS